MDFIEENFVFSRVVGGRTLFFYEQMCHGLVGLARTRGGFALVRSPASSSLTFCFRAGAREIFLDAHRSSMKSMRGRRAFESAVKVDP